MYSKAEIFSLALSALLLSKEIADPETDTSREAQILRKFYRPALNATMADLDLDGLSTRVTLELVVTCPNDLWDYAYKYPDNCAHFRRIANCELLDTANSQIDKAIGVLDNQKVIFCGQEAAVAEIIPNDLDLRMLPANAGLALSYKLAVLSAPLIVGKGASKVRDDIMKLYTFYRSEAQYADRLENARFESPLDTSEFVAARMS